MKRCMTCDSMMEDDCRFCSACGGSNFEQNPESYVEAVVSTEAANQGSAVSQAEAANRGNAVSQAEAVNQGSVPSQAKAKEPAGGENEESVSLGVKLLTGLLCILLTLVLMTGSILLLIRVALSESAMDVVTEKLSGQMEQKVSGEILDVLSESGVDSDVVEIVETLLEKEFAGTFLMETAYDYTEFLLYEEGKGYIEADDIIELIEDNKKSVEKALGEPVTEELLSAVKQNLEKSGVLEAIDFGEFEEEYEEELEVVRFVFSGIVEIFLAVIALLFIISIFVLRSDRHTAWIKTGGVFIITGIFDLLLVAGTFIAVLLLKDISTVGSIMGNMVLWPLRISGIVVAMAFVVLGSIFTLIGKLLKRIH